MECEKHLTGYFKDGDRSVVFSSVNYHFDLMTGEVIDYNKDNECVLNHKDGFIHGKTYSGKSIAVYCGESDFHVLGKRSIIVPAYVLSDNDDEIPDILEMRFIGGTLNQLNCFEDCAIKKEPIEFECETNNYAFHVKISITHEKKGDACLITPFQHSLTISFDKARPISSVFEHYLTLQKILSFLTRQQEVGFDEIVLRKWNDYKELPEEYRCIVDFAKMYIREEVDYSLNKNHNIITFDDLGGSVQQLFSLFYREHNDKKQDFFPKSFYPRNADSALVVTTEMIKSSCAIIETLTDVDQCKIEDLENLIKEVKKTIREYENGKNKTLSKDDFDYYRSSLKFWRQPLKRRIISLFSQYEEELNLICHKFEFPIHYCEQDIQTYINYRNTSTHALNNRFEKQTGVVQLLVTTSIYCLVLEKIGFDTESIKKLCRKTILNWR